MNSEELEKTDTFKLCFLENSVLLALRMMVDNRYESAEEILKASLKAIKETA